MTDFSQPPGEQWKRQVLPGSRIEATGESWRFINEAFDDGYTDSQIDDYQGRARGDFLWEPPVTLEVRARFSADIRGTAGFGFWNDPFLMTGLRLPALPRAIWFFYGSEENDLKLDIDTPGHGWKAATVDAMRPLFYLLAPTAPLAIPLMNIRPLYRLLWPVGQRAIGVGEATIDAKMTAWHDYRLDWREGEATFQVDGTTVLASDCSPGGPLGFVMWVDNQAMVVTPWGRVGWQALAIDEPQWMEVSHLRIE